MKNLVKYPAVALETIALAAGLKYAVDNIEDYATK